MLEKLRRIAETPLRVDELAAHVAERFEVVEGWIANNGGLNTALHADVLTLKGEVATLTARLEEVITALTGETPA
jgi:hypothetical protein